MTFEFDLRTGQDVRFISHRDGSDYSMFNAIQIIPIERSANESSPRKESKKKRSERR